MGSNIVELIKLKKAIRELIARCKSDSDRHDYEEALKELADNVEGLTELKGEIAMQLEKQYRVEVDDDSEDDTTVTNYRKDFTSLDDAKQYLDEVMFPAINQVFRLYKSEAIKQDEFIVVDPEWLQGTDRFQLYSKQADVADRLASIGIPPEIKYVVQTGNKTEVKKLVVLQEWKRDKKTHDMRINTLGYIPGEAAVVGSVFNTYKDDSPPAVEGVDISEALQHIEENICDGNKEYAEYIVNWLAQMFQQPSKRPKTAIALMGNEGDGKGILVDLVRGAMGERNCNTTLTANDTKKFNAAIGGKIFVVFDEATFAGDHEQSDFMKKLITEPMVRIEPKSIDAYSVQNYARVMITTNNLASGTPSIVGNRRWLEVRTRDGNHTVLSARANRFGNNGPKAPGYNPDFYGGFKHFLTTKDISAFNPLALPGQESASLAQLRNTYREKPVFAFLCEWLPSPDLKMHTFETLKNPDGETYSRDKVLEWESKMKMGDFLEFFKRTVTEHTGGKAPGSNVVGKMLEKYGIKPYNGAGNIKFLEFPHPSVVLANMKPELRFHKILTPEQEAALEKWEDFDTTLGNVRKLKG